MSEELPLAEIAHSMPGRSRLRIADRRGDAAFFASVAATLSSVAGVYKVEATPLTGSLLIRHGAPLERIGAAAREAGLFAIGAAPAAPPEPAFAFDPKILLGLGFLGVALWQMSRDQLFPPALTLLLYASRLHGLWPFDQPEEGE